MFKNTDNQKRKIIWSWLSPASTKQFLCFYRDSKSIDKEDHRGLLCYDGCAHQSHTDDYFSLTSAVGLVGPPPFCPWAHISCILWQKLFIFLT